MAGFLTDSGEKTTIDITADTKQNCVGSMTLGSSGTIQVVRNSSQTWAKPDAVFWKSMAMKNGGSAKAGDTAAALFKGRWLTGGSGDASVQGFAAMCDMLKEMTSDDSKPTATAKGAAATVDGTPALTIKVTEKSEPGTAYVATQGQPYLLRMESPAPDASRMDFSDFNKPVAVQAPPADQVIDMSVFQEQLKSA
jgi:hypothetical protein